MDNSKVTVTEEIAEWGYGDYEGLLTKEIVTQRKERGLDKEKPWDIWRDGCEGGEYVASLLGSKYHDSDIDESRTADEVTNRLDTLIKKIHEIQGPYMYGEKPVDVVVVR